MTDFHIGLWHGTDNLESLTDLRDILSAPDSLVTDTPDEEPVGRPTGFRLSQNYPNPFNPSTVIDYYLPNKSRVVVSIHNVLGRRIATLTDDLMPHGSHSVIWDGKDSRGNLAASGVYFYRIKAGNFTQSKQMLLLK